jgi:hypothetical protein
MTINFKQKANNCPRCNGRLVQGFVPDFTYGGRFVSTWHEGQPQKSFWYGTDVGRSNGLPIDACRCENFGLLEFYAASAYAAE